jgi:hypothetical protein
VQKKYHSRSPLCNEAFSEQVKQDKRNC